MRLISRDMTMDIPYEGTVVYIEQFDDDRYVIVAKRSQEERYAMSAYNSLADAIHEMSQMLNSYGGEKPFFLFRGDSSC